MPRAMKVMLNIISDDYFAGEGGRFTVCSRHIKVCVFQPDIDETVKRLSRNRTRGTQSHCGRFGCCNGSCPSRCVLRLRMTLGGKSHSGRDERTSPHLIIKSERKQKTECNEKEKRNNCGPGYQHTCVCADNAGDPRIC